MEMCWSRYGNDDVLMCGGMVVMCRDGGVDVVRVRRLGGGNVAAAAAAAVAAAAAGPG